MTIVDNCVKSINLAKKLKNCNIFVKDTFDLALKQAENSQNRILKSKLKFQCSTTDKINFKLYLQKDSPKSKLDGKTFTLKDNICTKSINTTCGSKMLENYIPPYDATVTERILSSGSVLLGKTNLDEFGMGSVSSSVYGTVKNPFNSPKILSDLTSNDFYISGGSSGGSAASVSSRIADLYASNYYSTF